MTYEQKAKELCDAITDEDPTIMWGQPKIAALITTALREAGNAKLEEALAKIGQGHWGTKENPYRHSSSEAVWIGMKPDEMIATIRSLIDKE